MAQGLKANTSLQTLVVHAEEWGHVYVYEPADECVDENVAILADVMACSPCIRELHLHYCCMSEAGAASLSRAIEGNTSLACLDMCHHNLSRDQTLIPSALFASLKRNEHLSTLNLRWNKMTTAALCTLSEALTHNTTLHTLDLSGCRTIDKDGCRAIASMLERNTGSQTLLLRYVAH
jgi:Ran GTPase-activating protein (RanGAP) involved in mRNA processing and transport